MHELQSLCHNFEADILSLSITIQPQNKIVTVSSFVVQMLHHSRLVKLHRVTLQE